MASATQLKDEGNKLYAAKDYSAAYVKYSEAIELDGSQAVFWANRAACLLAMRKYMDAASDCREATKIDPQYTKAWMRLGSALTNTGEYDESIQMYIKAQETLPKNDLTAEQKNLVRQCAVEIDSVRQRKTHTKPPKPNVVSAGSELPWQRAEKMVEKFKTQRPTLEILRSSAHVILGAYRDFRQGMDMIRIIRKQPMPNGAPMIIGQNGGLMFLTNGLLRDPRVFHFKDRDFIEKYNMQVSMEAQRDDACLDGGAQAVIAHALKLKKEGGWNACQPSIATTIRAWTMRAFVEDGMNHNIDAAMELFDNIVEILEWGRQVWRNEPKENRGTVFDDTFVRGVKCLRLETLMQASGLRPDKYSLDDLYESAQEIKKDVDDSEPSPGALSDPGFLGSFFAYPAAQACAITAFYYNRMAKLHRSDPAEMRNYMKQCAEWYFRAAVAYPMDDENHAWYAYCALEMHFFLGSPAKDVWDLFGMLRVSTMQMMQIWEFSNAMIQDNRGREHLLVKMLTREDKLREEIASGKRTEDDPISFEHTF